MNKIKFLKKYTYTTIPNFEFNVLIHFDYDSEVLLYSLEVEDSDYYDNINYLIEYASSKDEDEINEAIKKFMLAHVWSEVDKWIALNDYNELVMYIIKYFLFSIYSTSTLNVKLKRAITLYTFIFFYYRGCIAWKKLPKR